MLYLYIILYTTYEFILPTRGSQLLVYIPSQAWKQEQTLILYFVTIMMMTNSTIKIRALSDTKKYSLSATRLPNLAVLQCVCVYTIDNPSSDN